MGRLIDADKLKKHYAWWGTSGNDELEERKKDFDVIIDLQPGTEIVNCKECSFYTPAGWHSGYCERFFSQKANVIMDDNFCSLGRKK